MSEEPGSRVAVGEIVAGKYLVERVLGAGGMAVVLAARHVELDEPFALKFLAPHFAAQPAVVVRFTREAKAACRIRSEHVARVHDVGSHDGAPFIVMEHLTGSDLATVISERGALRIEDAAEYAMQACEALAAAHCLGIVHRDIKPENLFLVEHEGLPIVKLLDFGISKMAIAGGDSPSRLTGELSMGTPCYMSPEQIRSTASADERSDLWSLGVVLYELLTATQAFQAETLTELCAVVLEQEARPLCELRPDVPQALADIVARCMQKDPSRRFDDVAELAAALLPFAPSRALATAERAASLLAAARRASGKERISTLPSSVPAPWSERPIVADVRAAAPVERPTRSWIRGIAAACVAATGLSILAVASGLVRLPPAPAAAPERAIAPAAAARPPTIVATGAAVTGEAITMTSAVQTRPAAPPPPPIGASATAPRARRSAPRASASAPPPPSASAATGFAAEPAAPPSTSARAAAVELGY